MKAVEINKTGGPEVLEVKDITLAKPGLDEVTICLLYTSPSPRDPM